MLSNLDTPSSLADGNDIPDIVASLQQVNGISYPFGKAFIELGGAYIGLMGICLADFDFTTHGSIQDYPNTFIGILPQGAI
jgi:hypothetical protein